MTLVFFTTLMAFMQGYSRNNVQTGCKKWIQKKSCSSNPGSFYFCSLGRNYGSAFYRCAVHFDIYKVHTSTNTLFIKLDKVLKFTLKATLTCSYMFLSLNTTIIREPSLEPS